MSDVLLHFAEPLTKGVPKNDDQEFKKALSVAMITWNAALASERQREEMLRKFVEAAEADNVKDREQALELLRFMIQRKNQLFPKIQRFIVGFEVRATKMDRDVQVASTEEVYVEKYQANHN